MNDRKLNPLTIGAIENAALLLAKEKGHVTILKIKALLHEQGYSAMQSVISDFMEQLTLVDCDWNYFITGTNRIYFNTQFVFQDDVNLVYSLN